MSLDGDNFYTIDVISKWNNKNQIFVFEDFQNNPIYSYVKVSNKSENNTEIADIPNSSVIDIQEKVKISNLACTGAYGFESTKLLLKYCEKVITNKLIQKGELYISSVIKLILDSKIKVEYNLINSDNYKCLGTPLQIRLFTENNNYLIPKKRYCFDLDNTLV